MATSTLNVEVTYPGVYVQERNPSTQTIKGVGTSTAVFVGAPAKNPDAISTPLRILNFTTFAKKFGGFDESDTNELTWAVFLFYLNGGSRCYVLPTAAAAPTDDELALLNAMDDINLLVAPGVTSATDHAVLITYVEGRKLTDLFYIGNLPQTTSDGSVGTDKPTTGSSYVALYHPWLTVVKPDKTTLAVPPSGAVAGVYARTDSRRGVFKAPAGVEAVVLGIIGLDQRFSDAQNGEFSNGHNVNLLRTFDGVGSVVWGARTFTSPGAIDPWLYVPVRRMAIYLRVSLYFGSRFAVFEGNDEDLWGALRATIGSFMQSQFRRGAFQGTSAKQAFFVKVDDETTTQEDINNGVVNIVVGFAPLKPAEFVVVVVEQFAGAEAA